MSQTRDRSVLSVQPDVDPHAVMLRRKLLLISEAFPPMSRSGAFRPASFAEYLPDQGIDVVVLSSSARSAVVPHYPEGTTIKDVEVVRVAFTPESGTNDGLVTRVPGLAGWTRNRQLQQTAEAIWRRARSVRDFGDIQGILATAPPPVVLLVAMYAARELRIPYWCDLRDLWTYAPHAVYRSHIDLHLQARLEAKVLRQAEAVVVTTRTAREDVVDDFGLSGNRVHVVHNGFDERRCAVAAQHVAAGARKVQKFDVVYAGVGDYRGPPRNAWPERLKKHVGLEVRPVVTDGNTRSPLYVLEAISRAVERLPALKQHLRLRWVGPVADGTGTLFQSYERRFQIDRLGAVSEEQSLTEIVAADVLILLQIEMCRRGKDRCSAIPAKLFTYLRSGNPILAAIQPGELRDLVESFSRVSTTGPRDVSAIADAIIARYQQWCGKGLDNEDWKAGREGLEPFERQALVRMLATKVLFPGWAALDRREDMCLETKVHA